MKTSRFESRALIGHGRLNPSLCDNNKRGLVIKVGSCHLAGKNATHSRGGLYKGHVSNHRDDHENYLLSRSKSLIKKNKQKIPKEIKEVPRK